jgi:FMN phosphatase YigB (HAD superfamily)
VWFEKPHPEIFRWALEQARVEVVEAMYVGDQLAELIPIVDARLLAGAAGRMIDKGWRCFSRACRLPDPPD